MALQWDKLLSETRLDEIFGADNDPKKVDPAADLTWLKNTRLPAERDFDRVLFSTPVRRLADKTQVFPLERNESIRTRLTHSHEVANLARSFGSHLCFNFSEMEKLSLNDRRAIIATLSAVGLAHDLGNPPFGHQGEAAIGTWFKNLQENSAKTVVLKSALKIFNVLDGPAKTDFLKFEGNAQTLRVTTRLQVVRGNYGLNLTSGTLAALMKYTVGADSLDKSHCARKKIGFFNSEKDVAEAVFERTGLKLGERHPLAFIMEACDDIAYRVIDVEDAIKKQLASYHDLIATLQKESGGDKVIDWLVATSKADADAVAEQRLTPSEANDVKMQLFRVKAIHAMMSAAIYCFEEKYDEIMNCKLKADLLTTSAADKLGNCLKSFAFEHAYRHRSVLELELKGHNAIQQLMNQLWMSIADQEVMEDKVGSCGLKDSDAPLSRFLFRRISENYRRVFSAKLANTDIKDQKAIGYAKMQLLTDMISGMTDGYVLDLTKELSVLSASQQ